MKNKHFLTIIVATLTISVSAQTSAHDNYIGVSFGGGLNTALYNPANGSQQVGLGVDASLFYGRFFNKTVGLGVGLNYSWVNAYAKYNNWTEETPGLTHASNPYIDYTLSTGYDNFKERQNIGVLSIPVEVLFRKAFNERVTLIGGVGLSLDLPIHGKYYAKSGSYKTAGLFPDLGDYYIENMPEHGFCTYTTTQGAKINNRAKVGGSVIGDLGVRVALNDNWGMYFGVYAAYGFSNLLDKSMTEEMVMVNPTNSAQIDYRGTFDSNQTSKANLLRCGVKIAIDFGWPAVDKKKAEAERIAREMFVSDSIAAAAAAEQARLAREKAIADSIAAAEAARIAAADAERLAREKAIADSIAAAEAEHARQVQEAIARFNALKTKGESITVHFDTGADQLKFKDGEQQIMDEVCMVLRERHDLRIVVIGHTDNTGNAEQNLRYFGKKRAEALKAYMVTQGVLPEQIECESKGQNEPIAPNDTRANRALNRRANIKFL